MATSPDHVADAFFASINAGDLERAAELWIDDALFIPAGGASIHGKDAIREVLSTLIANNTKMSSNGVVTNVAGPVALRTGRLQLAGQAPDAEPFETVTEFVTVYALTGQGWRIAIDAPAGLP